MHNNDVESEPVDFRILFGPLFGVDISLPNSEVFFCVGSTDVGELPFPHNAENAATHVLSQAIHTLYIPHQTEQANFRIRLTPSMQRTRAPQSPSVDYEVDLVSTDVLETRRGSFNSVSRFGKIAFALKCRDDAWSRLVTTYVPERASEANGDPFAKSGASVAPMPFRSPRRCAVKVSIAVAACAPVMVLAGWRVEHFLKAPRPANVDLTQALGSTTNPVLSSSDGQVNVLTVSRNDTKWEQQALVKTVMPTPSDVAAVTAERRRIEQTLDVVGVDFITVRLDNPARPVLVLNGNPPRTARESAERALRQAAPYVRDVEVIDADLSNVEQQASNALEGAGVPYRRLLRSNGATFEVVGALGDEDLAALRNLIVSFGRKWGTRRVDFKISLRTDGLKGKSYREGRDGYVLTDHASWYFPQSHTRGVN